MRESIVENLDVYPPVHISDGKSFNNGVFSSFYLLAASPAGCRDRINIVLHSILKSFCPVNMSDILYINNLILMT
jgi:hypothetical protein